MFNVSIDPPTEATTPNLAIVLFLVRTVGLPVPLERDNTSLVPESELWVINTLYTEVVHYSWVVPIWLAAPKARVPEMEDKSRIVDIEPGSVVELQGKIRALHTGSL